MGLLTDNLILDLLTLFFTVITIIIGYLKWKYTYWQSKGVPTLPVTFPFGNAKDFFLKKKNLGEQVKSYYEQFKSQNVQHGGVYMGANISYIPISLDLIKHIIQKDFDYFMSHGNYHDENLEPLTGHLFNLDGSKWKSMRVKLTPTFTSGKMKMMFQTLVNCTHGLNDIMVTAAKTKTPVDIKEVLGCFTTDIIGSCAFGLECNSLRNPDAEFRRYGRRIFDNNNWDRLRGVARTLIPPTLLRLFQFKIVKPDVAQFFMNAVKDTVKYREQNQVYRKDFMHLLIQLKNMGKVTDDTKLLAENGLKNNDTLTMNELAAQAFVFFIAGFETSSTTMTWALYEIAQNPEIQQNIRKEIHEVLAKYNGEVTYDAIMEMHYLQKVIEETLRKYPPAPFLPRKCTKDYQIPNTSVVIKEGTRVWISVLGIHYDPEYYPNPEVFDPERFSEENKAKRPQLTWLPFGEGPRICIGLRFGVLQSKVGLLTLIRNFEISLNKKTKVPLVFDKNNFILGAEGGVWLDVKAIK